MNWEACIICGINISKLLKCPANSFQGNGLETYETFLENFMGSKELDLLPIQIKFDDETTAQSLFVNHAKWHKSCHLRFVKSYIESKKEGR